MSTILCFGEILWDCLPHGQFLGGAPFNVAYHLQQLGHEALMLSAIGNDTLGKETLKHIHARKLPDRLIQVDDSLPTGTVDAVLDARGNATYVFADPVAWDHLTETTALKAAIPQCSALVFGSLALRHEENRSLLKSLHTHTHWLRVFDVNLRAPYDNIPLILELAPHADVLKLNAGELLRLTSHASVEDADADELLIRAQLALLQKTMKCPDICVTRGAHGALWWHKGKITSAITPPVTVRDTIGAGDAFTAALVNGLLDPAKADNPQDILNQACALGAFVAGMDGAQPAYDAHKLLMS